VRAPVISFSELEKSLEKDLGDLDPELLQLARMITDVLNELDETLLEQDLPDEERRAIHQVVLKALECHMRGLPPPSEEVKFWMQMLDPKVFLSADSGLQ
jgi:hypothetical protein